MVARPKNEKKPTTSVTVVSITVLPMAGFCAKDRFAIYGYNLPPVMPAEHWVPHCQSGTNISTNRAPSATATVCAVPTWGRAHWGRAALLATREARKCSQS